MILFFAGSFLLQSCAVTENLKDGYQVGDITMGMAENLRWYCGFPMKYVRSAGRSTILLTTGITLIDPCRIGS